MTEYDYSPDAIERHLAKLDGIAKWVDKTKEHEPANPFVSLPGERTPSDSYLSPPQSPPQIQQQPYAYGYPYSYQYQYPYQTAPQYPQQQLYYPTQPQQAFYATPHGVISPTYSPMHTSSSSRHHRSRRSSSHHSSGSRSLRPSPTSTTYGLLPMALGPRSYSTPPLQTSPYGGSYMVQQQQLAQPIYPGYTTMPASGSTPGGSPYSAYSVPQVIMGPVSRGRSKSRSRSESYSASHSSSHHSGRSKSRSRPYSVVYPAQSQPQLQTSQNVYGATMGAHGSHSTPYLQPTSDQPVVVPINGGVGGYVVVPAKGQGVTVVPQQQYYNPRPYSSRSYESDSGSERGSFFGSLSLGRKSKKSRRHKRTGSY